MNKLPKDWKEVELGEICEITGGQPAPQDENAFSEKGVPFVRMQDLGKYHLTLNLTETKDKINPNYKKKFSLIKRGAILIPRSGSVSLNHRAILGVDAYIVSHICALTLKESAKIDNKFFYYALRRFDMRIIMNKTTGLDAINFSDLRKVKLSLPPLSIQKKIVSILEKAEKLKQKREEADKLTQEYLQSVFYEMFGDKAELKNLKDVCEIIMGQSPPGNSYNENGEGTPFFQGKAEFTEKYPIVKKWTTQPTKIALPNSVLMSVRAPVGSVNLCNIKCCIGRGLASIVPKNEVNLQYLYSWFRLNEQNISDIGIGSTFKAISSTQLANLKIPLPPFALQQKFASIVEHIEKLKEKQKKSKEKIDEMFSALMQRAFKGELVR